MKSHGHEHELTDGMPCHPDKEMLTLELKTRGVDAFKNAWNNPNLKWANGDSVKSWDEIRTQWLKTYGEEYVKHGEWVVSFFVMNCLYDALLACGWKECEENLDSIEAEMLAHEICVDLDQQHVVEIYANKRLENYDSIDDFIEEMVSEPVFYASSYSYFHPKRSPHPLLDDTLPENDIATHEAESGTESVSCGSKLEGKLLRQHDSAFESYLGDYSYEKDYRCVHQGTPLMDMSWECLWETYPKEDFLSPFLHLAVSETFPCPEFPELTAFVVVRNEGVDPRFDLEYVSRMYAYRDDGSDQKHFDPSRQYSEIAVLVDYWYDGEIRKYPTANGPKIMHATESCLEYASKQQADEGLQRKGEKAKGWDLWWDYDRKMAETIVKAVENKS